jgi:hypothetical protein
MILLVNRMLFSSVYTPVLRFLLPFSLLGGMVVGTSPVGVAQDAASEGPSANVVVDTFDDQEVGEPPDGWVFVESDRDVLSYEESREPGETMVVKEEDGDHFVRLETRGEALRYSKRNGVDFEWNLNAHPRISWRWRALHLPEGASEKGQNDTGGALYVTFGTDWLGRPKSIKYTYSSSLPVGTVVDFGNLYVIVVDSAREPRMGEWQQVTRSVRQDYRQVFGGSPPDRPVSITLWSDSDTTDDWARVDIDDIVLRPPHRSN